MNMQVPLRIFTVATRPLPLPGIGETLTQAIKVKHERPNALYASIRTVLREEFVESSKSRASSTAISLIYASGVLQVDLRLVGCHRCRVREELTNAVVVEGERRQGASKWTEPTAFDSFN